MDASVRPASAPPPPLVSGTGPSPCSDDRKGDCGDGLGAESVTSPQKEELLTRIMIDEMEQRVHNALGKENRGHKLPIEDLPIRRPRILLNLRMTLSPPSEDEFSQIEERFCELQHYYRNAGVGIGLNARQIRLLYTGWRPFVDRHHQRDLLHIPERLGEAGGDVAVKGSLAAVSLAHLISRVMAMIEEESERLKVLNRLSEQLLSGDESNDKNATTTTNVEADDVRQRRKRVLALTEHQLRIGRQYLGWLHESRSAMVQALRHSHLLGRFLIKRHHRILKAREHGRKLPV